MIDELDELTHLLKEVKATPGQRELIARCGVSFVRKQHERMTEAPLTSWARDVTCEQCARAC